MKFIRVERELGDDLLPDVRNVGFSVYNHKREYLGRIDFESRWKTHKQFIFWPVSNSFFTSGCLQEIVEVLDKFNQEALIQM